jgi:hypothetical protein
MGAIVLLKLHARKNTSQLTRHWETKNNHNSGKFSVTGKSS